MTPFAYYGLSFNPFDKQAILDSAVLSAVHSHTNGNPRLIDNLMTDALTLGSQILEILNILEGHRQTGQISAPNVCIAKNEHIV